jgi:RNA polymerase sigma-70 factor (ECF subfamily)
MIAMGGLAIDESTKDVTSVANEATHDLARVFREEGPDVWRTMLAFTGGRRDIADDVVAEAFARAVQHSRSIHDPAPWIYRVAFRLAREELERDGQRPIPFPEETGDLPDVSGLMGALRQLSPQQRAAIVLHYEADLPVAEIADRMGIAAATVRVHLFRGRARLRDLLGREVDES